MGVGTSVPSGGVAGLPGVNIMLPQRQRMFLTETCAGPPHHWPGEGLQDGGRVSALLGQGLKAQRGKESRWAVRRFRPGRETGS